MSTCVSAQDITRLRPSTRTSLCRNLRGFRHLFVKSDDVAIELNLDWRQCNLMNTMAGKA